MYGTYVRNKQKNTGKKTYFLLASRKPFTKRAGSGSVIHCAGPRIRIHLKWHGFGILVLINRRKIVACGQLEILVHYVEVCSVSTIKILRHSGVWRVADEAQYKFGLIGSHTDEIDIIPIYLHKQLCTCTPHLLGRRSTCMWLLLLQ